MTHKQRIRVDLTAH